MQATVRNLYEEKDLGTFADFFSAPVEPHGVLAISITPDNILPYFDKWRPWQSAENTEMLVERSTMAEIDRSRQCQDHYKTAA